MRNTPPKIDMIPNIAEFVERESRRSIEPTMIGKSVISGAIAIKIPLSRLPLRVSEMTRDNKGPGAIPDARPNVIPYKIYSLMCSENYI